MSTVAPPQTLAAKSQPLSHSTRAGLLLQRKCACGSPTSSLTGECAECTSKKRPQTKLTIGASNHSLELEANQGITAPAHSAVSGTPPHIQRYSGPASEAVAAPLSVEGVLDSPGRPLEPELRQDMDQRFGHDFSRVRVHSGTAAEQSARELNANAYTVGHNRVLGVGRFAPNDIAASSSEQPAAPITSKSDNSGISVQRADQIGNGGGSAPPANTKLPATAAPQAGTSTTDPILTSGSLTITEKPLSIVQQGGQILSFSMGFKIAKPFTVAASAQVQEPPNAELFEYGLVQNLFFDHIEEVFSDGDMLIDSVGPFVDAEQSAIPFIHANATLPAVLFTKLRISPSFTDIPSLEVMLNERHCKKQKSVELKSVVRSVQFRAGLVARAVKTGRLVPLGAISTTYGFKSQVDFAGASFISTDAANLTGNYPLSASASAVVTGGISANQEGQLALNTETASFKERCENVL
jgi:hypothetical protein